MNADVLSTKVTEGIAVITLGSAKRMYFDAEMGDALTESLQEFAGDPKVRVVIVTGGTPGYFNRHFSIPALIGFAEAVRASGREWPDNAAYHGGFFDKALALCETMPKPVIAAISGTALAGAFEFTLACDIRIAEDGDYLIGLPETELGLLPGASGTQRLPRTIGPAAALWHILMGYPLSPREAEKRGLVHETVSGKAIDRAMEVAKRFCSHTEADARCACDAGARAQAGDCRAEGADGGTCAEEKLSRRRCRRSVSQARNSMSTVPSVTGPSRFSCAP